MKLALASTQGAASGIWLLTIPQPPSPFSLHQHVFFGCFTELVTHSQSVAFTNFWLCIEVSEPVLP